MSYLNPMWICLMCWFALRTYEYVVLDAYVREPESALCGAIRTGLVGLDTSQLIQQLLSTALTHISLYLYISLSSLLLCMYVDMCGYKKSCWDFCSKNMWGVVESGDVYDFIHLLYLTYSHLLISFSSLRLSLSLSLSLLFSSQVYVCVVLCGYENL